MNKTYYAKSFKFDLLKCIQQLPGNVVLRADIGKLGSPRQISRSLKTLIDMGKLAKIGYGIYAKTYQSEYLNKPIIKEGFDSVCREALTKLGIQWEPGWAEKAYNAGASTQVPARPALRLKSRFRRRLSYGNRKLRFDGELNAR